jgi:putative transport protein
MPEIFKEPYVSLFIIMFFGVLLSKLEFKKVGFGSSGIVISAIFFGYFGMKTPLSIEKIGLILFIFAVGIQAGPGFFESFKTGEARLYLKSTGITIFIITIVTFLMAKTLGFDALLLAGLFSGITTSTPALAAIIENGKSSSPLITYAVAYPVALVTTVFTVRILSKYLFIDVAREEANYKKEFSSKKAKVSTGYFVINNPNVYGKSISEVNFHAITNSIISRIKRIDEKESFIPDRKTVLNEKDLVKVIGDEKCFKTISLVLGKRTDQKIEISKEEQLTSILVTKPQVISKSLSELNLNTLWGAEVREIRRAGVNIVPSGSTRLRFGDKILVSVKKDSATNLIKMLGGVESNSIDFLPISVAIVLGVLIGQITIPFGSTSIGPGVTGGILFTTLILGRIGKTGPMLWSIAGKTNQFLREIGIMLFLCGVGSSTGQSLLKSLTSEGLKIILATIFITVFSILLTSLISLKYLKMNRLRFLGSLAGSFTCSAALPDAKEIGNSSIPLTAYSVTYPFALLLTILVGQLLLFF